MNGLIWVPTSELTYDSVVGSLRVEGKEYTGSRYFDCWVKQGDKVGLPRVWAEQRGFSGNYSWRTAEWPNFNGSYRPLQEEKIKEIHKALKKGSTLFEAHTGFGKTLIGTHIASDLNAKTLVIAHKEELLDQWDAAAKEFFGVECGRIQGPRWDYGYPITTATIQTLAANLDRLPEITGQFGLTIIDEAHKFSCTSFHNVVPFLDSKYRLGVSATFRRADKLEGVWEHHLGKVEVQAKRSKTAADYKSPAIELEIDPNLYLVRGDISHSKLLTVLSEIPDYNKWAAEVIQTCFNRGRKILTISHRKNQCFEINTLLTQMGILSKVYVGKTTAADLQAAKDCGIILATDKKFSEGIDAPELDTLLLLTPFSDPEQIVGRIGRSQKNVNRALVIDPRINHPYLDCLYRKRVRVYERLGITNATDE